MQIQKLTKAFGGRTLFREVTWNVSRGDRVGLVGPNGAGKTTLLRMMAGLAEPDQGEITAARGTRVGFLPQDGLFHRGRTLMEESLSVFADILALQDELRRLEEDMGRGDPESAAYHNVLKRYADVQEEWERHEGFNIEARVDEVLRGLGFRAGEFAHRTETFSGGWQMRIALAKLLLSRPHVLLLDEPTNHLDLEARNWMEEFLMGYPHAVVLVSHDRFFLDQVVTRITEVDRGRLIDYTGSYTRYLDVREKSLAELRERAARQREEIERIQRFIDRFRYKASKAAQVQSRVKMLEKLERIELPPQRKKMNLRLPQPSRTGRVVVKLEEVSKRYNDKCVFDSVDLLIERGDRIALVGPNGAGKSTLMRLLSGVESPDTGRVELGHKVTTGYFSQDRAFDLDEERTVLENVMEVAPLDLVPRLRTILGSFLFRDNDVDKRVKVLSGGEKNRLAMAKMLLNPANILLLDEPTNHLDLDSKEVLLDALKGFHGTLVFVSHDRYFIDALATKVAEVGEGRIRLHWGNYEDFVRIVKANPSVTGAPKDQSQDVLPKRKPSRRSERSNRTRELRLRIERLEETISELETAISSLEGRMAVPGFYDDPSTATGVVETHKDLKTQLERLYQEWEVLAAEKEGKDASSLV